MVSVLMGSQQTFSLRQCTAVEIPLEKAVAKKIQGDVGAVKGIKQDTWSKASLQFKH